jgi:MSHA biogenesis protein MshJ
MKIDREHLDRQWARAARGFDQRPQRERVLLIAAAAVLLLWLFNQLWLDSQWQRWSQARQQRLATATALETLRDNSARQLAQQQARQQQAQADIQALRERFDAQAKHATAGTTGLVDAQEMLPLLARLLDREHGLRVRTLRSLGQTAVSGGEGTGAGTGQPQLYRHAVELSVEGSYADLLTYLQTLEALPHKLLWGSLQLKVEKHPQVLLTLRLYTLSQQAGWVEL